MGIGSFFKEGFEDISQEFSDIGKDFDVALDIVTFGGISKKKAGKRNARALRRQAELNAEVLRDDAQSVLDIAELNRQLALKDADAIREIGDLNIEAFEADSIAALEAADVGARNAQVVGGRIIGTARASFGASGVRFSGSPLVILADSERILKKNVSNILRGGAIRSERALSQAKITGIEADSRFQRFLDQADIIEKQGFLESERLLKRAEIVLETGEAAAEVQLLQGQAGFISGIGQGVRTGIGLFA